MTDAIRELIRLEPVRVRAVVAAIIGLLMTLGINLDSEGILGVIDTVLPWITAALLFWQTRSQVTPNAKVVVSTEDVERLGAEA